MLRACALPCVAGSAYRDTRSSSFDGAFYTQRMDAMPEQIRAFVAVRLPDSLRRRLAEVQHQLRQALPDIAWTRPEALHLTLQFLGKIESARLEELRCALEAAAETESPFELELGGIGSFGNRVIWVGVTRGQETLTRVAEAVRRATEGFSGHEEERAFNAHVTLGRCKRGARGTSAALRKVSAPAFAPWIVDHFELIRSELSPRGSRYTVLASIKLQGAQIP
jgi:RNA 2',3'-cyclic 3'-phosphodiesterase